MSYQIPHNPTQSQLAVLLHGHASKQLPEGGHHLPPLLVDGGDLLDLLDASEPGGDQWELLEFELVDDEVGDLEVVLQVGDGQPAARDVVCAALRQQLLQLLHRGEELPLGSFEHVGVDRLLPADALVDLEEDNAEERRPEEVLVPGQMLVDLGPLLRTTPVVHPQLLRELLAQVDQNGVALPQLEVPVHQERDLSQRIQIEILLRAGLVLDDVEGDESVRELGDVQQALDCAGRLAPQVPIQRQRHAEIYDMAQSYKWGDRIVGQVDGESVGLYLDVPDGVRQQRDESLELLVDASDLRDQTDPLVPRRQMFILRKGDVVDQHVGGFVKEEQIRNGEAVARHVVAAVDADDLVQQAQHFFHFTQGAVDLVGVNRQPSLETFLHLVLDDAEQGWTVGILIPGQILVNPSPFLRGAAVVLGQLFGEGLAEIDEDSVALAKLEIVVDNEGHLAEGIHVQIVLGLRLLAEQIHRADLGLQLAQRDEDSDCAGRLAHDVPIERQRHAVV